MTESAPFEPTSRDLSSEAAADLNPHSPEGREFYRARTAAIIDALRQGLSVKEAAARVGCPTSTVYYVAKKNTLPTNRPIRQGSKLAKHIVELHAKGFKIAEISVIHRITEGNVRATLARDGGANESN